ncbi:MAG TPA: DNA-3-methyladenine glycosylase I [Kineosporiaceae bacterium]|nr:DNA-3-methyladenine glycosylase I [Kineosporiaceae bacterium]
MSEMPGLVVGEDGLARCAWVASTQDYLAYHDQEWGRPVRGEVALYERFTLEAFQSGLSWLTILRKREAFRRAFDGFDPERVAGYGEGDVARLLADPGIVRNRAKVAAAITNAGAVLRLRDRVEGGLDALIWSFAPDRFRPAPAGLGEVPATTPESVALAKALRRHGFVFVGPTTAYAAMQACGLVDDHLHGCHARGEGGRP